MLIYEDARYRITQRLELTRHRLFRWNYLEIGDIFRQIEKAEKEIANMQMREDWEGGL